MKTTEALKRFISITQKSPLGFIKGDCRLVYYTPGEFPCMDNNGKFDDEDPFTDPRFIIAFSYKDKFIGEIKLKKEMIESCDFSPEKDTNLTLNFKKITIHVKCPEGAGFPYLEEFGEYISYINK
ncbi:MAG: hypothetical protein WCW04_02645 [Candidatus Paceibacterota bacterium]|jgi:hypothetical protein